MNARLAKLYKPHPYLYAGLKNEDIPDMPIKHMMEVVAKNFGITVPQMLANNRKPHLVNARGVIAYFLRNSYKLKLLEVAKHLKKTDHTTIQNLISKVDRSISNYDSVGKKYHACAREIYNYKAA